MELYKGDRYQFADNTGGARRGGCQYLIKVQSVFHFCAKIFANCSKICTTCAQILLIDMQRCKFSLSAIFSRSKNFGQLFCEVRFIKGTLYLQIEIGKRVLL